jgi:glycosyltransferase involved in cell wall biosynthesis
MATDPATYHQRTRHARWMDPAGQPDLVSIIIPTFNRATLLSEALASAAAQTYRPIEILVIDDGSTDNTPKIIQHWQEQLKPDSQISLRFIPQPNSGVSSARNHGLIESKGEFIQFLDSDDLLNPNKLSLQVAALKPHPSIGYIFSDWAHFETAPKWDDVSASSASEINSADLYCSLRVFWVMLGIYRRQTCYVAGPFCEDMSSGEDKEYNLRILLSTPKVIYLPGVLFGSRAHHDTRLTDAYRGGIENKMTLTIRRLARMVESAQTEGRLGNQRLVQALVTEITCAAVDSLLADLPKLARDAITICRKLPISFARRLRLTIYQFLSYLPKGVFPAFWNIWLKIRRAIFKRGK